MTKRTEVAFFNSLLQIIWDLNFEIWNFKAMHPLLFEIPKFEFLYWIIGPLPIRMYGLMIGMGFLAGIFIAARQARKEDIDPQHIVNMGTYLLLASIVGSRLLYVFTNLHEFSEKPLDVFAVWKGGLVFYGGLLAAIPVGIWYLRRHGLAVWKVADIMAPSLALGHGLGRLGCFFAGCCYGAPCTGLFCVTFSDADSLAPTGTPLHPTQLYEAGGEFLIFAALLVIRRYKKYDGQLFWRYALFYSILRFMVELYRGDAERGLYFGGMFSTSQLISIAIGFASLIILKKIAQGSLFKHELR